MDNRYKALAEYIARHFAAHLGPRLKSAFVHGSVVREDAVWGVSDLDLLLAFESPTDADTALKQGLETSALNLDGGEALVIQRVGEDRLKNMAASSRAYLLYSCRHDIEVLHGASPNTFLPAPPSGKELVNLIMPIIRRDGEAELIKPLLNRRESRHLAKRILHALTLPVIAEGRQEYVAPLEIADLPFPSNVKAHVPTVISI